MAAVANRDVLQHAVDDKIHEYGAGQNAVRHEIPTEPIEAGTDRSANNHHGEAKSRIEVFPSIEVRPLANWTEIDAAIGSHGVAEGQPQLLTAAAAANRRGRGVPPGRLARPPDGTVYANGGHAYAIIAGLRWDTAGTTNGTGPRWHKSLGAQASGPFTARHPDGY